jgi:hypothetical protein
MLEGRRSWYQWECRAFVRRPRSARTAGRTCQGAGLCAPWPDADNNNRSAVDQIVTSAPSFSRRAGGIERAEQRGTVDQHLALVEHQRRDEPDRVDRPHGIEVAEHRKGVVLVSKAQNSQRHRDPAQVRRIVLTDQDRGLILCDCRRLPPPRALSTLWVGSRGGRAGFAQVAARLASPMLGRFFERSSGPA